MSRKYTLKEVGSGYRRGGRIDKQYPKEFQRVAPLVQETQYILPWKQVGTLSFPLKAWNLVGFTDYFLNPKKNLSFCQCFKYFSIIPAAFEKNLNPPERRDKILQKVFFRFHHSLLTMISFAAVVGIEVEVSLVLTYLSTCAHLSPPSSSSLLSFIIENKGAKRQGKTKGGLKSFFCTLSLLLRSFVR